MSGPKCSIIVPVYRAEQWLRHSLDNVRAQTLQDWECILVDDGSPDDCGAICDEYAQVDPRFRVIHQPNGGVSRARQAGLEAATGEYVIHWDPDDWAEPRMLQDMYCAAKQDDADIVIADFWVDKGDQRVYRHQSVSDSNSTSVLRQILSGELHGSCWNKLVRRQTIERFGIAFTPDNLCYCEDELFCVRLLTHDVRIAYLPHAYYHYVQHGTGLSFSLSPCALQSLMTVVGEYERLLDISRFDNIYGIKRRVMLQALLSGRADLLPAMYPEIHDRLLSIGWPYRFKKPVEGSLALAIKGHTRIAIAMYRLNKALVKAKKKVF